MVSKTGNVCTSKQLEEPLFVCFLVLEKLIQKLINYDASVSPTRIMWISELRNVQNVKIMTMTVLSWDLTSFKFLCRVIMICILLIQIHYKLIISVTWFFANVWLRSSFELDEYALYKQNIRQLCCLVKVEITVIKIWIKVNELQHWVFSVITN